MRDRDRKDVEGSARSDPSDTGKKDAARVARDKAQRRPTPPEKLDHRLRADTDADYEDADKDSSAATMHRDGECSEE
ncbi:MAG TPA: hypothetical protein VIP11_04925 [Gemmatimonadaceae bacterium]